MGFSTHWLGRKRREWGAARPDYSSLAKREVLLIPEVAHKACAVDVPAVFTPKSFADFSGRAVKRIAGTASGAAPKRGTSVTFAEPAGGMHRGFSCGIPSCAAHTY